MPELEGKESLLASSLHTWSPVEHAFLSTAPYFTPEIYIFTLWLIYEAMIVHERCEEKSLIGHPNPNTFFRFS